MADAWNVGGYFHAVGEPNPGNFSKRRIRLLGSSGADFHAYASLERAVGLSRSVFKRVENPRHGRRFGFLFQTFSGAFFKLVNGRHKRFAKRKIQKSKIKILVFAPLTDYSIHK